MLTAAARTPAVHFVLIGIALFLAFGNPTPQRTLVFLFGVALLAVGVGLSLVASTVFNLGLRRYTSGSIWTEA